MFRFATILAVLVAAAPVRAAAPPTLDDALADRAKDVLAALKKKGYTNVGVVKFLVRQGDGPERDDAGDLNLALTNKTEVALILANSDEKFGIIDKASEVVVRERLFAANHRTAEGRKAFFVRKYELAWSRDKVDAAAFLTGVATLSADLKVLTVRFQVFDRSGKIEELPVEVTSAADPETIAQAGFSYALAPARQQAFVTGEPPARDVVRKEVVEQAQKAAAVPEEAPAGKPFGPLADCPIKWTVLYNGKPVPVTGASLPEPKPTDRIEFVLTNPGQGTYAVVLLVNGENTLYQERAAPAVCRKWVLGPDSSVVVRGFQTAPGTVSPFAVLPPDEPMPDAVRYGDLAGTFRLVVFHGKMSTTNPDADKLVKTPSEDASTLALARTRGATRPAGIKPQTLKALQADLRGRLGADGARGYVVKGGASEKNETTAVFFVPSPEIPVADVSLRYFTPKK